MNLEILSRKPASVSTKPPVLFVHGAYVGAWCWEEHFLDWFAARGYPAHALSLRGHGESEGRDGLDGYSLDDYAEDVARAAAGLRQPPVLVGHSMGALVVQKALAKIADVPAMVLACPVSSYGLLASSMSMAFTQPALMNGLNSVAGGGRASRETLKAALFAGPVEAVLLERCYRRVQRESQRALLDMAGWGLPSPWGGRRPPTLVLGAEKDALIPAAQAQGTARLLNAEYLQLRAIGHAVMMDTEWLSAAESIAGWLEEKGF
jgi:pimeloyl-ACP methyl ester carboxylesterase